MTAGPERRAGAIMREGYTEAGANPYGIPWRKTCRCVNKRCRHHMAIRAMWLPYVQAGVIDCWRCGRRLEPDEPHDLGHDDDDHNIWRGPECIGCNRSTATRQAERRRKQHARRWTL